MSNRVLPKSVVIVGAGPAGLFAARRLRELGVKDITLLEKENHVGGKCLTYTDQRIPSLKAEYGATAIACNYGVILDVVKEKNITTEKLVPMELSSLEIMNQINKLTTWGKVKFGFEFVYQLGKFMKAVKLYKGARKHMQPLPPDFELPFSTYAQMHGLEHLNVFLKPFVPGFGYGAMDVCPTYSILEYTGYLTIPTVILGNKLGRDGLLGIQGGFQYLMQRVANDLNVETSVTIQKIERDMESSRVTVNFMQDGIEKTKEAEALILAISPLHWPTLGMTLTPTELNAVNQHRLSYYRYPVAICRIKGIPPRNIYYPADLNEENFKHVALITTRDCRVNPEDGRLCTVYINLPPGSNDFTLAENSEERANLLADLHEIPSVESVEIMDTKIWEDYFSSLSWDMRMQLEKQQYHLSTNTMYVGSYTLGSFEDVACVSNRAKEMIDDVFHMRVSSTKDFFKNVQRSCNFFSRPRAKPVDDVSIALAAPALR